MATGISSVAPTVAARLLTIFQQSASDTAYSPRIAFVVQSIIEKSECLDPPSAPQLWVNIQTYYTKFSDQATRTEIHRAILVFAATCQENATKQTAKNFAVQNWQAFADVQLREVLEFLPRFQEDAHRELRTALVQQEFSILQNEIQNPTDRSKQRLALCYENRDALPEKGLDQFLVRTLESSDPAFEKWRVLIGDYGQQLENDFCKQIADKCLALVTNAHTPPRRQAFLELFATILPILDAGTKAQVLPNYFALCKHPDQSIHNLTSTVLAKVSNLGRRARFQAGTEFNGARPLSDDPSRSAEFPHCTRCRLTK